MQRTRAPTLLALLARRQQQQQQQQQSLLAAAAAATTTNSGGGGGGGGGGIGGARAASIAAAAAAAPAASWGPSSGLLLSSLRPTPQQQPRPWSESHHRTFFSWTGSGRSGSSSGSPKPPPPVDLDDAAGSSISSSISSMSGSPTAAGTTSLIDRFDAASATAAAAATSSSSSSTMVDAAAAADLSAAAAAVVNATRSAEAEAFVAAAADVWAPTRAFMSLFEAANEACGLPWWATIALVNLGVRFATLPLTLYTQKKAGGMAQMNEKMARVRELAAASSRATSMREFQALQAQRAAAMAELQSKHGGELRSSLVVPALGVLNAVVLVSQFSAVSTLAGEGVPSMARGGALWFPDLTVPDARYGLAAVCSALTLAMVEFGGLNELGQTMPGAASGGMRWFLRGMALLFLPAGAYVPAAVGVLWTGNAVLSLAQSTALRSPGLRKALGLPDMAKLRADQRKSLAGAAGGGKGGGLFAALTGSLGGGGGGGSGGAAPGGAAAGGKAGGGGGSSAGAGAPPPGQAPASSLLSTGRLYAQPAPSRKHANQIRAEVERRLRR